MRLRVGDRFGVGGRDRNDVVAEDGVVHDEERAEFLRLHLSAILDAIDQGVDVKGYFYWSLMDNFEWALGYVPQFGLVGVDRETQRREVKPSAVWLGDIARANRMP